MFGVGTLQYGSGEMLCCCFKEIMKARGYYQGDLDRSYGSGCVRKHAADTRRREKAQQVR